MAHQAWESTILPIMEAMIKVDEDTHFLHCVVDFQEEVHHSIAEAQAWAVHIGHSETTDQEDQAEDHQEDQEDPEFPTISLPIMETTDTMITMTMKNIANLP